MFCKGVLMAVCEQNNWGERVSARIAFAVALAFALALLLACLVPSRAFAADERYLLLADTHLGLPNGTAYGDTEKALSWAAGIDNLAAVCVAGDLTDILHRDAGRESTLRSSLHNGIRVLEFSIAESESERI